MNTIVQIYDFQVASRTYLNLSMVTFIRTLKYLTPSYTKALLVAQFGLYLGKLPNHRYALGCIPNYAFRDERYKGWCIKRSIQRFPSGLLARKLTLHRFSS